jgi:hypothetical protein
MFEPIQCLIRRFGEGILKLMRFWAAVLLLFVGVASWADSIVLIPIDSRPAAGQFAQMIGRIADVNVIMPPYEDLGRFTNPGSPDAILDWLAKLDYKDVRAVIVSTDMVAYGGLIASRIPGSSYELAKKRIERLRQIREDHKNVKFYGFTSIMRLYPTVTKASEKWGRTLGQYEEEKEKYQQDGGQWLLADFRRLGQKLPSGVADLYERTRLRDFMLQLDLVRMTKSGLFDYLIMGQDDAKPYGPFVPETHRLHELVDTLGIGGKVYFCEGIDQHSNVLVSRAILKMTDWVPRVRFVYADPDDRLKVANYESKDIEESLRDQIFASGARPTNDNDYDYTIYLNTPGRDEDKFQDFLTQLNADVDKGLPTAVADIDLAKDGTADPELFNSLLLNGRMTKLVSYAGWNTAGNTMGTTIPAANVYLYSKKVGADALTREIAEREFLLHRFVNDYAYHKYTRPVAYKLIDSLPSANRDETYGPDFTIINGFVRRDLSKRLEDTFDHQFLGQHFTAGDKQYEVSGLDGVKIFLPWPRVYEVRLEFKIQAKEVQPADH